MRKEVPNCMLKSAEWLEIADSSPMVRKPFRNASNDRRELVPPLFAGHPRRHNCACGAYTSGPVRILVKAPFAPQKACRAPSIICAPGAAMVIFE